MQHIKNIFHLGVKELTELFRDVLLMTLIVYSFSLNLYIASQPGKDSFSSCTIAIVDEDNSQLSIRLTDLFFPPQFTTVEHIQRADIDPQMDLGNFTFVLVIPPRFEKDVIGGKVPELQLNVDATRMSQAFTVSGYIQEMVMTDIASFMGRDENTSELATMVSRKRFNPNLEEYWFEAISQLMNNITMLAIILTGSALIRERENGTLEHLLVMPLNACEIIVSKIWAMTAVVLSASVFAVLLVVKCWLNVPLSGSMTLFTIGMALHLFAVTSMGIFLACIAQNMPQLGMLMILVLMPMQMLSGGTTPQESMPEAVRVITQIFPTTHFVNFSEAILFRDAGLEVVWKEFAALLAIGGVLFWISLVRFRKSAS